MESRSRVQHQLTSVIALMVLCGALLLPARMIRAEGDTSAKSVSPERLAERLDSETPPYVLDVRGSGEYWAGHIPTAVHIPHTELPERVDEIEGDRQILVYCEGEWRAREAVPTLEKAGFSQIRVLAGGIGRWRKLKLPTVASEPAGIEQPDAEASAVRTQTDKLIVHFFGASTCGKCMKLKRDLLTPLEQEFEGKLQLQFHDINKKQAFALMLTMMDAYGVEKTSPQMLFVSDAVLTGFEPIMNQAGQVIRDYLETPDRWYTYVTHSDSLQGQLRGYLRKKADQFSILGITAAGLADGLNPCAIATIIFLISFLTTQKRERSEVLVAGLSFTFAVYVTYLLLGLGAFQGLTELEAYQWLSEGLRWGAIGLAAVIGILCFIDAARYRKTKDTGAIRVQLPEAVKSRIHNVIKSNMSGGKLIASAVAVGFLVTLLEAVCTGQVYLPTIVLMTRSETLQTQGWLYLLYYCFLFVLPLLITMILAYFGLTWQRLSKLTKRHLTGLKIFLGTVLIALALFLYFVG